MIFQSTNSYRSGAISFEWREREHDFEIEINREWQDYGIKNQNNELTARVYFIWEYIY